MTEPTTTNPTSSAAPAPAAAGANGAAAKEPEGGLLAPGKDGGAAGLLSPEATAEPGEGAPEAYAAFKYPEGLTPDMETVNHFLPIFKDAGLSQAAAQKIVDGYLANQQALVDRGQSIQKEADIEQGKAWLAEAAKDPLIGGSDHTAKVGVMKRAIADYLAHHSDPALVAFLGHPAYQNHPGLARLVYYLGEKARESTAAGTVGGSVGGKPKTTAEVLYGGNSK